MDDGKFGAGRAILKKLKENDVSEMCVFVSRYYGGVHLGKRRFEIVSNLTAKAVTQFYKEQHTREKRLARSNSQSSLNSFASLIQSEMETEENK